MNDFFIMPGFDEITGRDKWNQLNELINGNDAHNYIIPVESVRYLIDDKYALDRVGEPSSHNSKMVIAIVESDEKLTVFTDVNGGLMRHAILKYEGIGIILFQD